MKTKIHPRTSHEDPEGEYTYSSIFSLTSTLDGIGWLTPRPDPFTPGEREPVPILQETVWAPGPCEDNVLILQGYVLCIDTCPVMAIYR
jgi:hypothetical protein